MWHLLAMMPRVTAAQDYSTGVTIAQDYSTGVSADEVSACMPFVTPTQDYSTGMSADVACQDGWSDNCSRLLN